MIASGFYNMDCMKAMKEFPDKFFDLAIVDPPYGDGGGTWSGKERFGERFDRYRHDSEGGVAREAEVPHWWNMGGEVRKKIIAWDVAPEQEYFEELFRISQNQIIWGGELLQSPAKPMFSDMA